MEYTWILKELTCLEVPENRTGFNGTLQCFQKWAMLDPLTIYFAKKKRIVSYTTVGSNFPTNFGLCSLDFPTVPFLLAFFFFGQVTLATFIGFNLR